MRFYSCTGGKKSHHLGNKHSSEVMLHIAVFTPKEARGSGGKVGVLACTVYYKRAKKICAGEGLLAF